MYCGLDFGTSNSMLGFIKNNEIQLALLDGLKTNLPSVMYICKQATKSNKIDEREVIRLTDVLLNADKGKQKKYASREAAEQVARNKLKSMALDQAEVDFKQQGISAITQSTEVICGRRAFEQSTLYPDDGIFTKSPKSFLGSKLPKKLLNGFELLVAKVLKDIKMNAESGNHVEFDNVVLGRPVYYGVTPSKAGNLQAIEIMTRAAQWAGFKNISFEYEPVAAALDFEQTLTKESKVLIVDIGGGTTDITMMTLSNQYSKLSDRSNHILASSGARVGGNDLDISIALMRFCRYLGKESLNDDGKIINRSPPVNTTVYCNATQINDVHAISAFRNSGDIIYQAYERCEDVEMKRMLSRLVKLHEDNLVYPFNRSAEDAKIQLSSHDSINQKFSYLDTDLSISLSRGDLEEVILNKARRIRDLIQEVKKTSQTEPDYIYFTGGSAKSPTLLKLLLSDEDKSKVVSGDQFASVVNGLTLCSSRRYN